MLKEILKERDYLPILKMNDGTPVTLDNWQERRREMIELLETYSYGKTPQKPTRVWGKTTNSTINGWAGKALEEEVEVSFETSDYGVFTFPIKLYIPYKVVKPSVILHIAFNRVPEKYSPVEEIIDAGYALVVVAYKDIVNDNNNGDFSDGLGAYFKIPRERRGDDVGKVGLWAYGASRVMDYLCLERDDLDTQHVAVAGHSRLGKTALWCAAQDKRFAAAISNESGYGGAASSKFGEGEKVKAFLRAGSWDFFCENFKNFENSENDKPYDQAFLLSLIAPRYLCVGSARLDLGADPKSEFLTSLYASQAWELFGEKGLVCPDRLPEVGDHFTEGKISYHLRDDLHFFSREDWQKYIAFLDLKFGKKETREYHVPVVMPSDFNK